jgi:hypothetical protein
MKLIIRVVLTALVLALSIAATAGSASAAPLGL